MTLNLEEISQIIFKQYEDSLVAVLLYGSFARKKEHSKSDVDIAVLLASPEKEWEKKMDTTMALSERIHRKIDMVYFEEVSPVLRMQILKNHRKIFMNESKRTLYYNAVIRALSEYFDLKRARAVIEKTLTEGSVYG